MLILWIISYSLLIIVQIAKQFKWLSCMNFNFEIKNIIN